MDGSKSRYANFKEYPTIWLNVPRDKYSVYEGKNWRIGVDGHPTSFRIEARRRFPENEKYEFVYQLIIINKLRLRKRIILRGVGTFRDNNYWRQIFEICDSRWKPIYNQFDFQAVAYAIIADNGLRKMHFGDENVYGKSTTVLTPGGSLEVPIQIINIGAPLLAKYIDEKKPNHKLSSCSEKFFQVFNGVHVQLKIEKIRSLLKFSAKFQVLNVKRYCEQQLIRREDLNVSDKKKFKMACKYNLNILMNQVLRNVKSVEELAELASIAIEMESMDTNISKLLIAKMYQIS